MVNKISDEIAIVGTVVVSNLGIERIILKRTFRMSCNTTISYVH